MKNQLINFAKDEWIKIWIQNIDEDEDEPGINKQTKAIQKYFDKLYEN